MSTKLSEHFSLEELTITSNAALQAANRVLAPEQVEKLKALAAHCERIREICGGLSVVIHSGYRSPTLNGATAGSSGTSQHPRCEAVDFHVAGQGLDVTFQLLLASAKAGQFKFGQLILEQADRGYKLPDGTQAVAHWCHCSLPGTLDPAKVGQAMRMTAGADGKQHYELVEKLP